MQYEEFLKKLLAHVSDIANESFGKVSGRVKADDSNQVLTSTDTVIGSFYIEEIKKAFSTHNIIDEEAGVIDNKSEFTWVTDPIDGTSNFANGIPTYGSMIGLLHNNIPVAGGFVLPAFNKLYIAEKGKGAWCNGQQIFVTKETNLLNTLVAYGIDGLQDTPEKTRDETKMLAEIILHIRNLRSSNSIFDGAMVAEGKYGGWLNKTCKIWDSVAQHIVLEEAGALYTDFDGDPIEYSIEKAHETFSYCMAPKELHMQLQTIIHSSAVPSKS